MLPIETSTSHSSNSGPLFISHNKILSQNQLFAKNCQGENIQNLVNCEYAILTYICNFIAVIVLTLWKLYELSLLKVAFCNLYNSIILVEWPTMFPLGYSSGCFLEDLGALCSTVHAWHGCLQTIHHFVLGPRIALKVMPHFFLPIFEALW